MDAWDACGPTPTNPTDTNTPPSKTARAAAPAESRKYAYSLGAVVGVLLVLWLVRPPFVCEVAKGMRAPRLATGRVLLLALAAGAIVLLFPACMPFVTRARTLLAH